MAKLAVIGASYLQLPLVIKAKQEDHEVHVFAWKEGNVVEDQCDFYYPVSILDKEEILKICIEAKIDGIISIGSDIAMPTVNFIADKLGLVGNTLKATKISTDKFEMRTALEKANLACPRFAFFDAPSFVVDEKFKFPVIVKPTDRSGSRGVTKVERPFGVNQAITKALENSISGRAIVEEFIEGREFSVEFISFRGNHYPLALTDKVTTGSPYFVEIEHHQPADVSDDVRAMIFSEVEKVLDALEIRNGASHTEVFLLKDGQIRIVECAGRMGGELIGSHMTELSTGFDFIKAAIDVSLGHFNYQKYLNHPKNKFSGVYYITPPAGIITEVVDKTSNFSEIVYSEKILKVGDKIDPVLDGAGKRAGVIVYSSKNSKPFRNLNSVIEFIVS